MRSAMTLPGPLAAFLLAGQPAVLAGEAGEAVRPFYMKPGFELEPEGRARFVDPALRVLEQDAVIRQGGEVEGCLDPALPFDDTDYDAAEVAATLDLREVVSGDMATVVASFVAEGDIRRVQWRLRKVDGVWKIADVMSMTKDWALSRFQCE